MPIESPDGQYVYFVRFTEGKFRLWRMRPDGSGESMVNAMPPLSSDGFEWWPFESGIYFYAYKDGNAEIDFLISAPRAFVESARSINLLLPGGRAFRFARRQVVAIFTD